jgi:hypothetical protein
MLGESILGGRASEGIIEIRCHQIRTTLKTIKRVDDYPYGGGLGMVMQADPLYNCGSIYAGRPEAACIPYLCRLRELCFLRSTRKDLRTVMTGFIIVWRALRGDRREVY